LSITSNESGELNNGRTPNPTEFIEKIVISADSSNNGNQNKFFETVQINGKNYNKFSDSLQQYLYKMQKKCSNSQNKQINR
jgi:hypothetical protein